MVLGLIDFLLGGKKKTKVSKTAQATTPSNGVGNTSPQNGAGVPDGKDVPTDNANQDIKFEDSNKTESKNSQESKEPQKQETQKQVQNQPNPQSPQTHQGISNQPKKSISVVINKIHDELKSTNTKITELVGSIKNLENNVDTLTHRVDDLDSNKKETAEKMTEIDSNMNKFLSLYELINNQYNPFVDSVTPPAKKVALDASGNSISEGNSEGNSSSQDSVAKNLQSLDLKGVKKIEIDEDNLDESLLKLDTLNIEQAAGDAVPLTQLKNNTNSLVIILSWLEYLIKKVGIDETRNSLRYYTEILRWITPEVYFDLDKYLRGMRDKKDIKEDDSLDVRDHIVSLYFISKLNEKTLDDKLTKAVLQIIKQ